MNFTPGFQTVSSHTIRLVRINSEKRVLALSYFMATEVDKVSSGRQPRYMNYKIQRFGDQLHHHHHGDMKLHHPDDGDGVGLRKVGFLNSFDLTICQKRFFFRSVRLSVRKDQCSSLWKDFH
jgi:hypothetical protein